MKNRSIEIFRKYLPILEWGKAYTSKTAVNDLVVAVIVTIMLIPQSLAYAQLAGLPPRSAFMHPWRHSFCMQSLEHRVRFLLDRLPCQAL